TGASSRRRCCGRRRWPPPPAGPPSSPAPTPWPPGPDPPGAPSRGPRTPPAPPVPCRPPGAYLLDPSPAVTRAGLVEELARELGAWKLGPPIAFLSPHQPLHTPFGRLLRVDASLPWNLKRLRQALRERGVGAVEVRKRGSAVDVAELTTRLRLGG